MCRVAFAKNRTRPGRRHLNIQHPRGDCIQSPTERLAVRRAPLDRVGDGGLDRARKFCPTLREVWSAPARQRLDFFNRKLERTISGCEWLWPLCGYDRFTP